LLVQPAVALVPGAHREHDPEHAEDPVGAAQEGQRVQDERHGGAAGAAAGGGGPLGARLAVPAVLAFRRGLLVPVPTGSKPVPVLLFAGFGPLPPGPLLPVG